MTLGCPKFTATFAAGCAFGCVTPRRLRRAQAGASRSPSAASWLGVSPPTRVGAANALVQDCNWRSNAHRCAALRCSAVARGSFAPGVSYWLLFRVMLGCEITASALVVAARRQSPAPAVMAASRQIRGARRAAGAPTATCRRCARSMRACCSPRPSLGCWARRRSRSGRGRATWRPAAAAAPAPPAPARRPRGATPPASSAPARRCRARSASQWRSRRRSQWRAGFPGRAAACVRSRTRRAALASRA